MKYKYDVTEFECRKCKREILVPRRFSVTEDVQDIKLGCIKCKTKMKVGLISQIHGWRYASAFCDDYNSDIHFRIEWV